MMLTDGLKKYSLSFIHSLLESYLFHPLCDFLSSFCLLNTISKSVLNSGSAQV